MTRWMAAGALAGLIIGTSFAVDDGYKLLWDGKTTEGWRSVSGPKFPKVGWEIKDCVLAVLGRKGGDVITTKKYRNFDLCFEFKITSGANSGVKYFIEPEKNKNIGCEYQILDDAKHEDAKKGINGNRTMASLYDIIPARTDKRVKPVGEWNEGRIVVNGNYVKHYLNSEKVVDYDRTSSEFKVHFEASKFKKIDGFAQQKEGHILLQDHNDIVYFRNIKIRELPN